MVEAIFDSKALKAQDLNKLYDEAQSTYFPISFAANCFADDKYKNSWNMLRGLTPDPIITTLRRAGAKTVEALGALLEKEPPVGRLTLSWTINTLTKPRL